MLKKILQFTTLSYLSLLIGLANASVPAAPLSDDNSSAVQSDVALVPPVNNQMAAPFQTDKSFSAAKASSSAASPAIAQPFTKTAATTTKAVPQNNIPLHNVHPVQQSRVRSDLLSDDNHFYLGADFTYEYFNSPDFGMGSPGTQSIQRSAIYKAEPTQFTFAPTVIVGYRFNNNFFTSLFGHHADAELNLTGFNSGASDSNSAQRSGGVWRIDGGGTPDNPEEINAFPVRNFHFHSSIHYQNASLYYRGEHVTTNPHLEMQPFVGLVYTHLTQDYASSLEWSGYQYPLPSDPWYGDTVNEGLKTDYWGIGFGNNLDYRFTPRFGLLTELEVQLLYARSTLDAHQVLNTALPVGNTYNVTDSSNKFTYRAKLAFGPEFRFTTTHTSPSIDLLVGLDQWGYMPEIYNPRGAADTSKAHIINSNQLSPYVSLGFKVPLA